MEVVPRDLQIGDVFKHQGVRYKVVAEPTPTRYSNWSVLVERLGTEVITLDYALAVEVSR